MDNNLVAFLVIAGWIISLCLHEFGHALVAYVGGDKTVKEKGYLSLNPLAYTDFRLSILVPTFFILLGGIGLPGASVLVNDRLLKNRYWSSAVSAAGPAMSILFTALLIAAIRIFPVDEDIMLWSAASYLALLETVVVILNLLPVPGLDGFGIIEPFLSEGVKVKLAPLHKYGFLILFGVLWTVHPVNKLLWDTAREIVQALGVRDDLIIVGYSAFEKGALPIGLTCIAVAAVVAALNKKNDWSEKVKALYAKEQYKECLEILDKATKDHPANAEAWRMKSICCALLYYAAESKKDNPQITKSTPERDFKGESLEALDKTLELRGRDPQLLYLKANCMTLFGDKDNALESLKEALATGDAQLREQAKNDPALALLREDERFAEILDAGGKAEQSN